MKQNHGCHNLRSAEVVAAAFEEAYRQYYAGILQYIYCRTHNLAIAEELTAEVFARLVNKLQTFHDRGRPLRSWLYIVARNLVIDCRRRDHRLEWLPLDETLEESEEVYPAQQAERHLERDRVLAALNYLTESQRQVIVLKFMEGYSNAETGAILGKDENSVKSLQHRALVTLRRVLMA